MKNKVLWGVIIALMVLDFADMTFGRGVIFFGLLGVITFGFFSSWVVYFSFLIPLVLCILIAKAKQYKMLWLAAVPTVSAYLIWSSIEGFVADLGGGGTMAAFKLIPTCAYVLVAYLCIFIAKKIKTSKQKKEEEPPC